jgi:hypothetical protein
MQVGKIFRPEKENRSTKYAKKGTSLRSNDQFHQTCDLFVLFRVFRGSLFRSEKKRDVVVTANSDLSLFIRGT